MTTHDELPAKVIINYQETDEKPPPLLEVGALAWIRKNLFGSSLDIFLTLFGAFLIVFTLISLYTWTVSDANWNAVTMNFRQFMLGRFEREYEWRVVVFSLYLAVTAGVAIAAWVRHISRTTLIGIAIVFAPIFILPVLIRGTIPVPATYLTAGTVPIVSGTASDQPQEQVAFVGQEGQVAVFRFASIAASDEELQSGFAGFSDVASNTLFNSANNRLNNITRADELVSIFAEDAATIEGGLELGRLTENQRVDFSDELAKLQGTSTEEDAARIEEIEGNLAADTDARERNRNPLLTDEERLVLEQELILLRFGAPSTEIYEVNQHAVQITIRAGETMEVIGEGVLEAGGDALSIELPTSGWYALEKTILDEGVETVALLEVENVSPVFVGGVAYRSITNGFEIPLEVESPRDGSDPIEILDLIQNQYRGRRDMSTYLRVYLLPLLELLSPGTFMLLVAVIIGYIVGRYAATNFLTDNVPGRFGLQDIAGWMLILTPFLLYIFINGIGTSIFGIEALNISFLGLEYSDPRGWGGLLLAAIVTVYGIILSFPLGVALALGRRSSLPAVKYFSTLYIELVRGTPFIVVLFTMQVLIPFVHPSLASIPNAWRAIIATIFFSAAYLAENVRGGLQSLPPGQEEAGKAVGLSGWQVTAFITMPQALRAVIPALVGQFIGLFKDTSLLSIVGLTDLLRVVTVVSAQTAFKNTRPEAIIFVSIVYFIISYVMSYVSRRIEETGSGAARRM